MLLFYQVDEGEQVDENSIPRHMLGKPKPDCVSVICRFVFARKPNIGPQRKNYHALHHGVSTVHSCVDNANKNIVLCFQSLAECANQYSA